MNKFKTYGCILLGCISFFLYGIYASETKHGNPPKPHQWVLTGIFGIYFMSNGINNLKKL